MNQILKVAGLLSIIFTSSYVTIANANHGDDPYQNLKFYYGDNHFHTGFSGDNTKDLQPIDALMNAVARAKEWGTSAAQGGDPTDELGGYFMFFSDHVHFIPTRKDMTNKEYQVMKQQTLDSRGELSGPRYTFTSFDGGEVTGLARNLPTVPPWDDKFGHLNIFNLKDINHFSENILWWNIKGTDAMDLLTTEEDAIGQMNHPGYNNEPRTGDDGSSLYPYTPARDKVFKFFEITDGMTSSLWDVGVAQYNICLHHGYHISPVIGSDVHDTRYALPFRPTYQFKIGRTVILAPSTVNIPIEKRRKILLDSVRKGLVYASENLSLHIKVAVNGFPMGHQFSAVPDMLNFVIDVKNVGIDKIKTIELLRGRECTDGTHILADNDVTLESQCTMNIAKWSFDKPEDREYFSSDFSEFKSNWDVKSDALPKLSYIYLKVTMQNGERAMTTPFFF